MRAYVNGLAINSGSEIFVRVYDKGLTANAVRINVMVGDKINVKKVHFSYLIFSPKRSPFASYGGGFNEKNFATTKVYDIHKIIYPSPYVFYGFMGMKLSHSGSFGFTSSVDDNLQLKISSSHNFAEFTISYIVLGNSPAQVCSNCAETYIYKDQCVNSCPAGSYPFSYRDTGKGCR